MPDPISWSFVWPYFLAAFVGAYVLGSIPFGLLLTRAAGLGDIRAIGSGSIGATNVLRTGRKWLAALTLVLDGAKGTVAVLLAQQWGPDMGLIAGFGALIGHMFPVWLGFNGGKGMATALGVWLAIAFPVGVAACASWLVVAALFRYSSLASLLAVAASPLYAWFIHGDLQLVEFGIIIAAVVWVRHHANLRRLASGQEPRIGRTK